MFPDQAKNGAEVSDTEVNETEEFDAAFDDFASPSSAPADAAADDEQDGDPGSDGDDGERQPEGQPSGVQSEAAASAPAGKSDDTDDIWKDAPPALREAYQAMQRDAEHRERSLRGRLSASDRIIHQLRTSTQSGGSQSQGTEAQPQETAADDLLASDEFKQFQEEYGEVAGPIASVLKAMQDKINRLSGNVGEVQQEREQLYLQTNESLLTEAHPDWMDCIKDERFYGWLESQPASIREAAKRNWNGIVDPDDAGIVFERFKLAHQIAPKTAPSDPADPGKKPQTDAKRRRQLESGRDTAIKQPSAAAGEPNDFDAAFDSYSRKADQRRQQHRGL
ncbi:hypothetical protein [Sphingomonas sp.]|uniref:hypothetical protein n=1 Tax=Sphingomonas sp. TaxID=28214 RepID=UPI00307DB1EA